MAAGCAHAHAADAEYVAINDTRVARIVEHDALALRGEGACRALFYGRRSQAALRRQEEGHGDGGEDGGRHGHVGRGEAREVLAPALRAALAAATALQLPDNAELLAAPARVSRNRDRVANADGIAPLIRLLSAASAHRTFPCSA